MRIRGGRSVTRPPILKTPQPSLVTLSSMTTNIETFQFQAEARQVLDLMIHSLYTNKEIFFVNSFQMRRMRWTAAIRSAEQAGTHRTRRQARDMD